MFLTYSVRFEMDSIKVMRREWKKAKEEIKTIKLEKGCIYKMQKRIVKMHGRIKKKKKKRKNLERERKD